MTAWRASLVVWLLCGCSSSSQPGEGATGDRGAASVDSASLDGSVEAPGANGGRTGAASDGGDDGVDPVADGGSAADASAAAIDGSAEATDACPGGNCEPTGDCDALSIVPGGDALAMPGALLFLHDRSGSMAERWNGATRAEAVAAAVEAALQTAASGLRVGTVFFPSPDPDPQLVCIDPSGLQCLLYPDNPALFMAAGSCVVSPIEADDQIAVSPVETFLASFAPPGGSATAPYQPITDGYTPLLEAMQRGDAALSTQGGDAPRTVVLITDGQPNCMWDAAMAEALATAWTAAGITLHLIVVPGISDPTSFDDLALAAGATLHMTADPTALRELLETIVAELPGLRLASCTLDLEPAPPAPEAAYLIVTAMDQEYEVPRDLGGGSGWSLGADGRAELHGDLCADALAGRFDELEFLIGCDPELPLLPAP